MNELWPNQALIKVREVAAQADICLKLMYELIHTGQLKAQRVGRNFRIPRAEALRFLGLVEEIPAPPPTASPAPPPPLSARARRFLRRS